MMNFQNYYFSFLVFSGHIPLTLSTNDPDTTLKVSTNLFTLVCRFNLVVLILVAGVTVFCIEGFMTSLRILFNVVFAFTAASFACDSVCVTLFPFTVYVIIQFQ